LDDGGGIGCFFGGGEGGGIDDAILNDGVWVTFLMFSFDFSKMYTGHGPSRYRVVCLKDMETTTANDETRG